MLFKNFRRDLTPLVFAVFAVVGGFLEVFTFVLHGGVFCNAQTGNVVMFVLYLVRGDAAAGLRYLWSIAAYILGIVLTAVLPDRAKVNRPLVMTLVEIAAFVVLAFFPAGASDWYTYAAVSFLCAVQYNTFTQMRGNAVATTFCTNNIRQMFLHLVRGVREKDGAEYRRSGAYLFIVLCFAAGAALGVVAADGMGNWCILVCAACLLPVLALFSSTSRWGEKRRPPRERGRKGNRPPRRPLPPPFRGRGKARNGANEESDLAPPHARKKRGRCVIKKKGRPSGDPSSCFRRPCRLRGGGGSYGFTMIFA